MKPTYDVVIVGGGLVGATCACALAHSPLRVALIADSAPVWQASEIALRVSAITIASQRIFAHLGIWEKVAQRRISPFRAMQVWDSTGHGQIHFDSALVGEPALGWIVENALLHTALFERLKTVSNVELYCPMTLEFARPTAAGVHLHLQDGSQWHTQLLVGADGAHSKVRQWASIDSDGWDYGQKALVATVSTEQPHQETAWQRFLPTGPLAFLPLADGCSSIVWSTTPEQADVLLTMDNATFAVELAEAFDWQLGAITAIGPRATFALKRHHARAYVSPHIALIGDAAHVVHPLAGQGVNLGFLDAAALADVVLTAHKQGRAIGSYGILRRYERWRKGHNMMMLTLLDAFKELFGHSWPPLQWLRNVGLHVTDHLPLVKTMIIRQASGLAGDLPPLARPLIHDNYNYLM